MPKKIPPPPREELEKMYLKDGRSQKSIAEYYEVSFSTVTKWLDKHKIPIRSLSEANKLSKSKQSKRPTKEELERMYVEEKMSTIVLAEHYNVSSSSIRNWMDYYEIPKRTSEEASTLTNEKPMPPKEELERMYKDKGMSTNMIGKHYSVASSTVNRWLDKHKIPKRSRSEAICLVRGKPIPLKEELEKMYKDEQMTQYQIGKHYDVSISTVNRWLDKHKIPKRTQTEANRLARGKSLPPKEELQRLHIDQKMSARSLGEYYNVAGTTVLRWIKEYDLVREDQPSKSQQLEDLLTEYIGGDEDAS